MKQLLMGNEAIAYGALRAGVGLVCGYPGTPSTEVLETVARLKRAGQAPDVYVEWSVNEKSAMEVAAGAAYAGMRCMVTMKQVGLNVASDPLMSFAYVGLEGGTVILVADDPGPISSQTEQDTRTFASFAKVPVFDPCSPEEAYRMVQDAFELSEREKTPVILRPTTRVCHASATIETAPFPAPKKPRGFVKDPGRWVIFPRLSFANHAKIEARNDRLSRELSDYPGNELLPGEGRRAVAVGGVSAAYTAEAQSLLGTRAPTLRVGTPFPFPTEKALSFLKNADEVFVFEELDPVIERELTYLCGRYGLRVSIHGKLSGEMPRSGENGVELIAEKLAEYLGVPAPQRREKPDASLPVRPPTLCAGCPHRASFYAVKQAMKGRKCLFAGDIGCYTLGNAKPLDMTDTCLCMGAGITIAQGVRHAEPDTVCFSFTGDSTFFHTGLAGIANAVYNGVDMVPVILDNSTTAMTGRQPNPSTGVNAVGEVAQVIDIAGVLRALGVSSVQTVDPLDQDAAVSAVRKAADAKGVNAIIFRSPCVGLFKPETRMTVEADACIGCTRCIREIGCPAISFADGKAVIDNTCVGCGLCTQICPVGAIGGARDV